MHDLVQFSELLYINIVVIQYMCRYMYILLFARKKNERIIM